VCAEVILRERDRERRVGGQVEFGVTLAPVSVLMRGWLVNVDCCVWPMGYLLLDDGDVDRGESARAVNLFGHGCECVNVVELLIWTRGSKRTREIPPPTSCLVPLSAHAGSRCRSVPYSNLISRSAVSAYPTPSFAAHIIILRVHLATLATTSHNHENRRYGPRGQVPCR